MELKRVGAWAQLWVSCRLQGAASPTWRPVECGEPQPLPPQLPRLLWPGDASWAPLGPPQPPPPQQHAAVPWELGLPRGQALEPQVPCLGHA
jgi:hypothetical protein